MTQGADVGLRGGGFADEETGYTTFEETELGWSVLGLVLSEGPGVAVHGVKRAGDLWRERSSMNGRFCLFATTVEEGGDKDKQEREANAETDGERFGFREVECWGSGSDGAVRGDGNDGEGGCFVL
jgi:hypothetical protein